MAFARTVAHATAADGTFSAAGIAAWDGTGAHTPAVSGATSGGIPYFSSTTTEDSSALLAAGAIVLGGGAATAPLTSTKLTESATAGGGLLIAAGTATTDVAAMSLTRTNNNAAVATGVKWTFTDTTSAAGFLPFQILGGSGATTNLISISKTGYIAGSPDTDLFSADTNKFLGNIRADGSIFALGGPGAVTVLFEFANQMKAILGSGGTFAFSSAANGTPTDLRSAVDTNLSRTAAGEIAFGTGAVGSAAGTCRAAAYKVGATAGASFGPGLPTTLTFVNGICTAAA